MATVGVKGLTTDAVMVAYPWIYRKSAASADCSSNQLQ